MSLPRHSTALVLLLAACVPDTGFEGAGARGLGEGDAGPDSCDCLEQDEPESAGLPTVRQDLPSWTCRADGEPQPVAFFDADSTLRVSKSGSVTADDPGDVNVLPFVARKIRELAELGYLVAVVSNQGGVGSGHQSYEDAEGALAFTVAQLGRLGATVHYFDFAEAYDEYRKPQPGMGTRLDGLLKTRCGAGVDLGRSLMIGDSAYKKNVDGPSPDGRPADDFSNSDRLFAESLGVWFSEPLDAFGWRAFGVYNIATEAELRAFVDAIDAEAVRMESAYEDPSRAMSLHREAAAIRAVNGW